MTEKRRFTTATVAALPAPESGREFYHDAETRGLAVRVSATGERVFYLYRKVAGKPLKVALGAFDWNVPASREIPRGADPLAYIGNRPALNLRMARALADAVTAELNKGANPADAAREARRAREGELTLAQAFDRYESDYLVPHGKRSATDLRACFERYIGTVPPGAKKKHGRPRTKSPHGMDWSRRRLSTITPADVRRLMIALKDGHGPHTANRVAELLRAVYNKVAEWNLYAGANPCARLEEFHETSRERFLKPDEVPAFFKAANALPHGPFRDFVFLSLFTGARRANVLGMRWADIDLAGGVWTVPAASSKNRQPLTIPLTARAADLLQRRRDADPDSAFVFPATSASGHLTAPKKPWRALLDAAGLSDLRLHDLRRSLGSWAVNTGASLPVIGAALGHRSAATTQIYARLQVDPVREAMQRAQDAMLVAAEAAPEKPTKPKPPKGQVIALPRKARRAKRP